MRSRRVLVCVLSVLPFKILIQVTKHTKKTRRSQRIPALVPDTLRRFRNSIRQNIRVVFFVYRGLRIGYSDRENGDSGFNEKLQQTGTSIPGWKRSALKLPKYDNVRFFRGSSSL